MDKSNLSLRDKPAKKTLHLKIAFICLFTALFPFGVNLFIPFSPIILILISLSSTLLSIVLLFWLLKPLNALTVSARNFSDGNLNTRADIRSGDEFEDVANSFNLMAEKLSKLILNLEDDKGNAISQKNKTDEILSALMDGVIALDFNKNILLFNKASSELSGFTESEVIGKPIDQLIHFFAMQDEIVAKTYCQDTFNQITRLVGKDGKETKINLYATATGGPVSSNLSCILVLHDLSKEEELERMKLDFVSMASHELKTPLTSIVGYLSVYINENRNKLTNENSELLTKAFTAAQQLQTLIQNLLNVNKIERQQLSVSPEPTDYDPLLSKAVEDLKAQANQKNIVLNLTKTENLPKVLADPIRIIEVLTNLIINAINYTGPGGKVDISTTVSPTEITTIIEDTGVGIPKEAIPHLFSKFFRVSNLQQKASKGTGLGLYISKSIIEKLHGKIWVESEEGKGSKFLFTIPTVLRSAGMLNENKFTSQTIQSGALNY